uniref:7TM_GPCR_Srx domain-containing protein n=1 Tax=Parastrongyloides trichosuri TaxID=131310 RepID=A0A0N4Z562_PARTI
MRFMLPAIIAQIVFFTIFDENKVFKIFIIKEILILLISSCIGGIGSLIVQYFITDDVSSFWYRLTYSALVAGNGCSGTIITSLIIERIIAIQYINTYENIYYRWILQLAFILLYLTVYGTKFPFIYSPFVIWYESLSLVTACISFIVLLFYVRKLDILIKHNFKVTVRMIPLLVSFILYSLLNKINIIFKCLSTSIFLIHITLKQPIIYYFRIFIGKRRSSNCHSKEKRIDKGQNYFEQLTTQWQKQGNSFKKINSIYQFIILIFYSTIYQLDIYKFILFLFNITKNCL